MSSETATTFQRARSREHKVERREAILAAATELAARDGVRAVTLTAIAAAVGMHKSALLRYFETREEILLEVAARAWRGWSESLQDTLTELDPARPEQAADRLAEAFLERPLLCDLIAHMAASLEHHVTRDAVRAYKITSLGATTAVADALAAPLPDLDGAARRELVSDIALLAGGMWQIAHPPAVLAELYADEPELGHQARDLPTRLLRAARVILTGLADQSVRGSG